MTAVLLAGVELKVLRNFKALILALVLVAPIAFAADNLDTPNSLIPPAPPSAETPSMVPIDSRVQPPSSAPAVPEGHAYLWGTLVKVSPEPGEAAVEPPLSTAGLWKEIGYDFLLKPVGKYLWQGIRTAGVGFFLRRPTEEELKHFEDQPWTRDWYKPNDRIQWSNYKILNAGKLLVEGVRYTWPYQWIPRIASVTVPKIRTGQWGQQHLVTPGEGYVSAIERMTCSRVTAAVTGKFVTTLPLRIGLKMIPGVAGFMGIGAFFNWRQSVHLESHIQGNEAEFLDAELKTNLLLKPLRQALKKGAIDQAEARRQAHVLIKESEDYPRRVSEAAPALDDGEGGVAFVLWSLNTFQSFKDLRALADGGKLEYKPETYTYPEGFSLEPNDKQLMAIVLKRHHMLYRLGGAKTLINDVTKKEADLAVDDAGKDLLNSRSVRAVLGKLKEGKIDEGTAQKYIHIYLDFDQELAVCKIMGFEKKARMKGPDGVDRVVDEPLTLDMIENDIIARLPK